MTSGPHVATPSSHCHHGDHSCMDFNQFPLGVTDLVLPLHVLRNSRFLLWAFSDRAWDSYISSPGGTVQKLRGWLSRSHPRLMSCPKGKFWDAFGTLLWTLPGMNLRCPWEKPTRPSLWAGFPTVSVPPPPVLQVLLPATPSHTDFLQGGCLQDPLWGDPGYKKRLLYIRRLHPFSL